MDSASNLLRFNDFGCHDNLCALGWVNLYQKFEIEKYTVCDKLILPKKWMDI